MGTLRKLLGGNLRRLRGDKTQVEFAKLLGISKSSLNRIEIGEQNVSVDTLEIMAKRLKIDASELVKNS